MADRPGVRSNARRGVRPFPIAQFVTSAVGRCPFLLAKYITPAAAGVSPHLHLWRGGGRQAGGEVRQAGGEVMDLKHEIRCDHTAQKIRALLTHNC